MEVLKTKRIYKYTDEYRKKQVEDFLNSGESKEYWSRKLGIHTRTLSNWIKKFNTETENLNQIKFIELTPQVIEVKTKAISTPIKLEVGSVKLELSNTNDIEKTSELIKAVLKLC